MGTELVVLNRNRYAKTIFVGVAIIIACLIILGLSTNSYELVRTWSEKSLNSKKYTNRGIGTNKDLWLNGYLGIFFRFKYFGSLNWLFIPLSIYFLANITKKERWEIALWTVVTVSCVFLCIKGYANYRYQFTLFPMILSLILLFGWGVVKKSVIIKRIVFIFCATITFMTFYALRNDHIGHLQAFIFNKKFTYPNKMINYINNNVDLGDDGVIFESNQPILYYYTNKKGLSYRDKKLGALYSMHREKGFRFLKNKLNVKYILTDTRMEFLSQGSAVGNFLQNITTIDSDLVIEDNGYKIYKLKESPYNLSLDAFKARKAIFETNFSDWHGKDTYSFDELVNADVPIRIQGYRGDVRFQRISIDDGNALRVKLHHAWPNVKSEIQFGFVDEDKLCIEEGDLVSVIARLRLNKTKKKSAQLFIQDKTKKWVREKVNLKGGSWQDCLITKRIRRGVTAFNIGIYWEPGSKDEWLDVKSIRIYVRGKERCPAKQEIMLQKQAKASELIGKALSLVKEGKTRDATALYGNAVHKENTQAPGFIGGEGPNSTQSHMGQAMTPKYSIDYPSSPSLIRGFM